MVALLYMITQKVFFLQMGVTLSRLASVQRCLEKLDESIKSLMEAREMLGNNEIYIAIILSKLSVVYRHKGDSKNSLRFAEEAAEITDKHHERKDHPGKCSYLLLVYLTETHIFSSLNRA